MNSNQKAFDDVVRHLFTQKKQCLHDNDPEEFCAYRGPDGLKCAIGALIKEEYYLPMFEGESVSSQKVYDAVANSGYFDVSRPLLRELQETHDGVPIDEWRIFLRDIAINHELNTYVLDQMEPIK